MGTHGQAGLIGTYSDVTVRDVSPAVTSEWPGEGFNLPCRRGGKSGGCGSGGPWVGPGGWRGDLAGCPGALAAPNAPPHDPQVGVWRCSRALKELYRL